MVLQVAFRTDALEDAVQDGGFSHAVDAAQDVHVWVKRPQDVLPATPKGVNLYLLDVVCVFHNCRFFCCKYTNNYQLSAINYQLFCTFAAKIFHDDGKKR
jgi:hypothetical protein